MNDFYLQAVQSATSEDSDGLLLRRLLGWMLGASHPFKSRQLRQAFAVRAHLPFRTPLTALDSDIPAIVGRSEGLVQASGIGDVELYFAHSTIPGILSEHGHLLDGADWKRDIAITCLEFMALKECLHALLDTYAAHPPTERQAPTGVPFLDWAAYNWHSNLAATELDDLAIGNLQEIAKHHFFAWNNIEGLFLLDDGSLDPLQLSFLKWAQGIYHLCTQQSVPPLAVCCYFRWTTLVEFLLPLAKSDINQKGAWQETALHLAIGQRSMKLVNTLLLHGSIDINVAYIHGQSPLHMAVAIRFHDAAEIFVDRQDLHILARNVLNWTPFELLWRTAESPKDGGADVFRRMLVILLRHPDIDVNGNTERRTAIPLTVALEIYMRDRCSCLAQRTPSRTWCTSCGPLRLLLKNPNLRVPAHTLYEAIANREHDIVRIFLKYQSFDSNMDVGIGQPALITALHLIYLDPWLAKRNERRSSSGAESYHPGRLLGALLRRKDFDANRLDSNGHTLLDWLYFYRRLPSILPATRHRWQLTSSMSVVLDAEWRPIVAEVIACCAGDMCERDLERMIEDCECFGGKTSKTVDVATLASIVMSMTTPDSSGPGNTKTTSFSSLAVERDSVPQRWS